MFVRVGESNSCPLLYMGRCTSAHLPKGRSGTGPPKIPAIFLVECVFSNCILKFLFWNITVSRTVRLILFAHYALWRRVLAS